MIEIFLTVAVWLLIVLVYLAIGFIIAVPYCYLAGGTMTHMMIAAPFLPAVALVLVALYLFWQESVRDECQLAMRTYRAQFFLALGYVCSPQIIYFLSRVLEMLQMHMLAVEVYEIRFMFLAIIPIVVLRCLSLSRGVYLPMSRGG